MCIARSRVNSYGDWWEVKETSGEIIEELRSLDEEDWIRLTDCVTGDLLWLKAQGIVLVASADSGYAELSGGMLEETQRPTQVSATLGAVEWSYDRRFQP